MNMAHSEGRTVTDDNAEQQHTIEVNQVTCVGAGQCVFVAPDIFTQRDEDGIVELLVEHPDEDRIEDIEEAIDVCPARAIALLRRA